MSGDRLEDDLLGLAELLAGRVEEAIGEAALRRAMSTAYYALFHAICHLCAEELVGRHGYWETFTPIYRTPEHGALKAFFEKCREKKDPGRPTYIGPDVAKIAETFIELQEARHRADYDPEPFAASRTDVIELAAMARKAVDVLRGLDYDVRVFLAVSIVAKSRK